MDIKQIKITGPSRKLSTSWTLLDIESSPYILKSPKIDTSKLSNDEQADLIVEKLRAPPKKSYNNALNSATASYGTGGYSFLYSEELMQKMYSDMAAEIDKEVLAELYKIATDYPINICKQKKTP